MPQWLRVILLAILVIVVVALIILGVVFIRGWVTIKQVSGQGLYQAAPQTEWSSELTYVLEQSNLPKPPVFNVNFPISPMPDKKQLKVWQIPNSNRANEIIFGCNWEKTGPANSVWTLNIYVNAKAFRENFSLPEAQKRLDTATSICLIAIVGENLKDEAGDQTTNRLLEGLQVKNLPSLVKLIN